MSQTIVKSGTDQAAINTVGNSPVFRVLRRDGSAADFDPGKISLALTKAFIAAEGESCALSSKLRDLVGRLTNQVVETMHRRLPDGGILHIEHIQDQVELALMRAGEHEVARRYVLYREARAKERAGSTGNLNETFNRSIVVVAPDGSKTPLDHAALRATIVEACEGLGA